MILISRLRGYIGRSTWSHGRRNVHPRCTPSLFRLLVASFHSLSALEPQPSACSHRPPAKLLALPTQYSPKQSSQRSRQNSLHTRGMSSLIAVDYEVFGRVQKVFFRKYTEAKAKSLGLRGWVMNTSQGTVVGQVEGPVGLVQEMKRWLQEEGSPMSNVDKAVFTNERDIQDYTFPSFDRRR